MQEFECSECGYRKWERESYDLMMEIPMYESFGAASMVPIMNSLNWTEDEVCPNCGKSAGWHLVTKK